MRHFKNKSGIVFAYDETQGALIDAALDEGMVELDTWPLPKTESELNSARAAEIMAELMGIDAASARPARSVALAIASGKPADEEDLQKLNTLELQAVDLRAELAAL